MRASLILLLFLSAPTRASGAQERLPDASQVRETLTGILSSSEYDSGRPDPKGWSFWDWLTGLLRKIFSGLAGLGQTAPVLFWMLLIACVLVLAAIFLHAGVVVTRSLRATRRSSAAGPVAREGRDDPPALLEKARAAMERGQVTEAIRLCHRAALLGMDRRGLVRFQESLTTGDYTRQLGSHPRERTSFESLARLYEPAFFGKIPAGREQFAETYRLAGLLLERTPA